MTAAKEVPRERLQFNNATLRVLEQDFAVGPEAVLVLELRTAAVAEHGEVVDLCVGTNPAERQVDDMRDEPLVVQPVVGDERQRHPAEALQLRVRLEVLRVLLRRVGKYALVEVGCVERQDHGEYCA